MGRPELPVGEGLLLQPAPMIHTAFMRFPIDAVFLDADLQVLEIVERLHSWRVAANGKARAVLELAAGECARSGIGVGDQLATRDTQAGEVVQWGARGPLDATDVPESINANSAESEMAPTVSEIPGDLVRPWPTRVLVISQDRRFRTVTSILLTRRGCSVITTANASRAAQLASEQRADVVVIDASEPSIGASQAVATVEGLTRPVGIVVVGEHAGIGSDRRSVLAKWGAFGDLFVAIGQAERDRETQVKVHERS